MTTIDALIKAYGDKSKIPYAKLLETKEWNYKRGLIIQRDGDECTNCNNRTTEYLIGKHIWWLDYIGNIKQPNEKFWEKLDYYEKLLGDKFVGISMKEEDNEYIEEGMQAAVTVDKQYYLQVHHKFYVEGRLPWEYSSDDLITLCNWCHFELHQREVIPVYSKLNEKLYQRKVTLCTRCHGAGFFPEYKHVYDGICFRCNGKKYDEYFIHK